MFRFLILLALIAAPVQVSAAPRVVASIAPIYSIVADVMAGAGQPSLLIQPGRSPHSYSLRPSEARQLAGAELVLWIGPELESFLVKPLSSLAADAVEIALMEVPDMLLLPYRDDGHDGHSDHSKGHDPHLWLSPANAARIAVRVGEALAQLDPEQREIYVGNAERAAADYQALSRELQQRLAPLSGVPYLVFHDAYRYFEQEMSLNNVGAITLWPELAPGVERMSELRKIVSARGVRCVFSEPQFPERLAQTVAEGTGARIARIDPLGVSIEPGPGGYEALIREFAGSLEGCLGGPN